MGEIDSSIPLGVRTANIGDLISTFQQAKKIKADKVQQDLDNSFKQQNLNLNQNQDNREQNKYNQELTDLATKRADARHAKVNSLLGEEAETILGLPQEKRQEYYTNHVVPGLQHAGFDTSDLPPYDESLPLAWRQNAMTPGERATERTAKEKAINADAYDMKIDGTTGKYYYTAKDPRSGLPDIPTDKVAPPQVGVFQGPTGPMGYTFPKIAGGNPTGKAITDPGTGVPIPKAQIPIPTQVQSNIRDNANNMVIARNILTQLGDKNTNPTGPLKEVVNHLPFGSNINAYLDPKGEPTRELIGELSSLKMKSISGAVINAHEMPRLAVWIPKLGDSKEVVKSKLTNFTTEIARMNQEIASQYTNKQGYREDPLLKNNSQVPVKQWKAGDTRTNSHGDPMIFDGSKWGIDTTKVGGKNG